MKDQPPLSSASAAERAPEIIHKASQIRPALQRMLAGSERVTDSGYRNFLIQTQQDLLLLKQQTDRVR